MHDIDVKLRLHAAPPRSADCERLADWLVVAALSETHKQRHADPLVAQLVARRKRAGRQGADTEPLCAELADRNATRVAFVFIDAGLHQFDLLTLARKLAAVPVRNKATRLGIALFGFTARERERIGEALLAALYAACAVMPNFKSKAAARSHPRSVELFGSAPPHAFRRTLAEAEGNALARHLSVLPPNVLTPAHYLKLIRQLARRHGWKLDFLDERALARRKAGAFLAVAQGSPTRDAGIVHLRWQPHWSARGSVSTPAAPISSPRSTCSTCTRTCRAARWRSARCWR
jgi:leucyl aminopeptidase